MEVVRSMRERMCTRVASEFYGEGNGLRNDDGDSRGWYFEYFHHMMIHLDTGGSDLLPGERFSISPKHSSKTFAVAEKKFLMSKDVLAHL